MGTDRQPPRPTPVLGVLVAVVLVLAVLLGVLGWRLWSTSGSPTPAADVSRPEAALATLDGGTVRVADYEGQVVLIDFWATWCGPCHLQADILEPIYEEYRDRGVEFLAVSLGEDPAVVRDFVERDPYPYPVLLDPQDEVSGELGIYVLPTLMVLDREGRVTYFRPGIADAEKVRSLLDEAGAA